MTYHIERWQIDALMALTVLLLGHSCRASHDTYYNALQFGYLEGLFNFTSQEAEVL